MVLGVPDPPVAVGLRALGEKASQDRYVIVGPEGAHQAIFLDYGPGEEGSRAVEAFALGIRAALEWRSREVAKALTPRRDGR